MFRKMLYIILFVCVWTSHSQEKELYPNFENDYFLSEKGDTLTIELDEVAVLRKPKFSSQQDVRYYYWLRRKVFKAYPFAVLATKRADSLQQRLSRISSKRKRKKYTKQVQKYLEKEFTSRLKKMTHTEGRILIKLIHRQTGKTAFSHIKEIRSGWNAFWYNTTANLFKLSLKTKYLPATDNEDYLIEDILQRAFMNEKLEEKAARIPINFIEIVAQKKGTINVEKYKKMFQKIAKKKKKQLRKKAKKSY